MLSKLYLYQKAPGRELFKAILDGPANQTEREHPRFQSGDVDLHPDGASSCFVLG